MKIIALIITAVFCAIFGTIWRGYVLSVLWGWFIVTTFNMQALSVTQAIGLSCVVSFLTYQFIREPEDKRGAMEIMGHAIAMCTLHPLIALAVGWVVKSWM